MKLKDEVIDYEVNDLKIDVSTFGLFFLPGHVNERSLDVIVNDFGSASGTFAHLLFVSWIAFDTEAYLLQSSLFQYLFGHIAVLDILEKSIHRCAENGYYIKQNKKN